MKKCISLFLCMALCLSLFPVGAFAEENDPELPVSEEELSEVIEEPEEELADIVEEDTVEEEAPFIEPEEEPATESSELAGDTPSGVCGDDVRWNINAVGQLRIEGTGPMWDFSNGERPWDEYVDSIQSLSVGDGVTRLGEKAFQLCQYLTELHIGGSIGTHVESIGNLAFEYCTGLTEVTIPNGIKSIGMAAFAGCENLTAVTISATVESIGTAVFQNCHKLSAINVSPENDNFCSIDGVLFNKDATELYAFPEGRTGSYSIPNSVKNIRMVAFFNCQLTGLVIPAGVEKIARGAFDYVPQNLSITYLGTREQFEQIDIDESGNEILNVDNIHFVDPASVIASGDCGDDVRWNINAVGQLRIEGTGPMWDFSNGERPWDEYVDSIQSLSVGDGVTRLGEKAFQLCQYLTELHIGGSIGTHVESIGNLAFEYCTGLTEVTIPNGIKSIGMAAFAGCENLTAVTLSATVESIGTAVFQNCHKLSAIDVSPENDNFCSIDGVLFNKDATELYAFPEGRTGSYSIPNSVKNIRMVAFFNCQLTGLVIPAGVEKIARGAFDYVPQNLSITYLGTREQFEQIDIDESGNEILNVDNIHFVDPASVIASGSCGESAVWTLTNDGVMTISGTGAMYDYENIGFGPNAPWFLDWKTSQFSSVVISNGITHIGASAFCGCWDLTSVSIADSVTSIGEGAFMGSFDLTEITLPSGVTSIGSSAFSGCSSLTSVEIPNSVTSIGDYAFSDCAISEVSIGANVNHIGTNAFDGSTVNVDPNNAFYTSVDGILFDKGMTTLLRFPSAREGSYTIPDTVTTIGDYAFYESRLSTVIIPASVQTIGEYAFYCTGLREITIPASVEEIGDYAFSACSVFVFTVDSANKTYSAVDGVLFDKSGTILIACPVSRFGSYVIPDGVTVVRDSAYYLGLNYGLDELTIPVSVKEINGGILSSCKDIYYGGSRSQWREINFGGVDIRQIQNLDSTATVHYAQPELTTGKCGEDLTWTLDDEGTLTISGSGYMEYIGDWSAYFYEIRNVVIEDGVKSIYASAFECCWNLESVTMTDSVELIGDGAFFECKKLKNIRLSNQLTRIGGGMFFRCFELESIQLPAGIIEIGEFAFSQCSSLRSVAIPYSVRSIGTQAFYGCKALESIRIPSGVTRIEEATFCSCSGLSSIELPADVNFIGTYAFLNCCDLTDIHYGGTMEQWNSIPKLTGNDPLYSANLHFSENTGAVTTFEELKAALVSDEFFVEIAGNITIEEDLAVSDYWKGLRLDGTITVPEGRTFTIETANLNIKDGSKVTVENGGRLAFGYGGAMIQPNGKLVCDDGGQVISIGDNPNPPITVWMTSPDSIENVEGNIVGIAPILYTFYYDVFDPAEYSKILTLADSKPGYVFTANIRCGMGLSGDVPENVQIRIDNTQDNSSNTVRVPAGETLNISGWALEVAHNGNVFMIDGTVNIDGSSIVIIDSNTGVVVNGTLNLDGSSQLGNLGYNCWIDVNKGGVINADNNSGVVVAYSNSLNINGGTVALKEHNGWIAVENNGNLHNNGTITLAPTAEIVLRNDSHMHIAEYGSVTVAEGGRLTFEDWSNIYVARGGKLNCSLKSLFRPQDQTCITVEWAGSAGATLAAVPGLKTGGYEVNIDVRSFAEFEAALATVNENPGFRFHIVLRANMSIYGSVPENTGVDICCDYYNDERTSAHITIPAGQKLIMSEGSWLSIGDEHNALTVEGSVKLNRYAHIEIGGWENTLNIAEGGRIDFLADEGHMFVCESGTVNNRGTVFARNRWTLDVRGRWDGNDAEILGSVRTLDELKDALTGDFSDITVLGDIEITESLTIPSGKYLYVDHTNFTVKNGAVLTLSDNSELKGSDGSLFTVEDGAKIKFINGCDLFLEPGAQLVCANGACVEQDGPHIAVSIGENIDDARAAVSGLSKEQFTLQFDLYSAEKYTGALEIVNSDLGSGYMYALGINNDMEIFGNIPANTELRIMRNWEQGGRPITVVVPKGQTLTADGSMLNVCGDNALFVVKGALSMDDSVLILSAPNCRAEINGTLSFDGNGIFANALNGVVDVNGKVVLNGESGITVNNSNTVNINKGGEIEYTDESGWLYIGNGGTVNNKGSVRLIKAEQLENEGTWTGTPPSVSVASSFTVRYDANFGVNAPEEQTKTAGEALILSSNVPTRFGHSFKGWAFEKYALAADYQPGAAFELDADATLYAVWEELAPAAGAPVLTVSSAGARPGNTVFVHVSVGNNPGIVGMTLSFGFDRSVLTLKSVSANKEGLTGSWVFNENSAKAAWYGNDDNQSFNGRILTLEFEVAEGAVLGSCPVSVNYENRDICNSDREPIDFYTISGAVRVNNHIPGDVDGDGRVGSIDFVTLMQYIAGKEGLVYDPDALDINNDGNVNTVDFVLLMKFVVEEPVVIY